MVNLQNHCAYFDIFNIYTKTFLIQSKSITDEVAVIDEIQLMRDLNRGWAWTRALLGIPADEIHLCGEAAAIELVYLLSLYCITNHISIVD